MFEKAIKNLNKLTAAVRVARLYTEFQFEQCQPATEKIKQIENVKALGISPDEKWLNQRFFRTFNTNSSKPCLAEHVFTLRLWNLETIGQPKKWMS